MICILLVAGHETILEDEIQRELHRFAHLEGVPKALLPGVGGKRILDYWWSIIKNRQLFSQVFLVCNADKFKHFERWATANDFPLENIVNDGTTSFEGRMGALADLELALRVKASNADLLREDYAVIAGDMLFQDHKFDLSSLLKYFQSKKSEGDLAIYYELDPCERIDTRGILEICPFSKRITKFWEKPRDVDTTSRNASVVFYFFRAETKSSIDEYLELCPNATGRSLGYFMEWYINTKLASVFAMKVPTGFQLIGQTSLKEYEAWVDYFSHQTSLQSSTQRITKRAYARVGLIGNPSDGFNGKTISLSIKNFWADVTIFESKKLVLTPHPLCDPTEFGSLSDLHGIYGRDGYLGGLRLLQATCKKFYHYCSQHGIALAKRNFTLKYDTNIPRQVGLAGSSAIVTATLKCLMNFFNLTEADLPKPMQPQFILDVEKSELNIGAGLQDRVIQVYEGLVYMDFSKEIMDQQGHGTYSHVKLQKQLPKFFLAYVSDPSDSGKIHHNVFARWQSGDKEVCDAVKKFAQFTDEALEALEAGNWETLADLMNQNFDLRRKLYGDQCLGHQNLEMVQIGRKFGAACKFPGSGGAILGLQLDESKFVAMKNEFQCHGYVVIEIIPNVIVG